MCGLCHVTQGSVHGSQSLSIWQTDTVTSSNRLRVVSTLLCLSWSTHVTRFIHPSICSANIIQWFIFHLFTPVFPGKNSQPFHAVFSIYMWCYYFMMLLHCFYICQYSESLLIPVWPTSITVYITTSNVSLKLCNCHVVNQCFLIVTHYVMHPVFMR